MSILKNRNCLVTGGTRGIGREIAELLKKEEANVFAVGREFGDLSTSEGVHNLITTAYEHFGNVEVLINCAGVYMNKDINRCSIQDFQRVFNLNVQAPWMLAREFSFNMKNRNWGRIVNIGSIAAYNGFPNGSIYCGSKHALLGISRALRGEFKPYGVRVYCISPSATRTDMGKEIPNEAEETFLDPKEVAEYVVFCLKFNNELISEEVRLNRFDKGVNK